MSYCATGSVMVLGNAGNRSWPGNGCSPTNEMLIFKVSILPPQTVSVSCSASEGRRLIALQNSRRSLLFCWRLWYRYLLDHSLATDSRDCCGYSYPQLLYTESIYCRRFSWPQVWYKCRDGWRSLSWPLLSYREKRLLKVIFLTTTVVQRTEIA